MTLGAPRSTRAQKESLTELVGGIPESLTLALWIRPNPGPVADSRSENRPSFAWPSAREPVWLPANSQPVSPDSKPGFGTAFGLAASRGTTCTSSIQHDPSPLR